MNDWKKRNRPICLEKRFEFDSYEQTRIFLDMLGDHSEKVSRFPDLSFGKTYVNITLRPESEEKEAKLTEKDQKFALEIDLLFNDLFKNA